jgi:hypothetical protein
MTTVALIKIILVSVMTIQLNLLQGQNCSFVQNTRVKSNDTETVGESVNSKDFYALLIEKTFDKKNKTKPPIYSIELVAASRIVLTDSMLNTKGTFELVLLDNSVLTVENVTYKNNPLGYCCALGFKAEIEEDKIKAINKSPIVTLKVKDINLTTTFAEKKQKLIQTISGCLLIKQL